MRIFLTFATLLFFNLLHAQVTLSDIDSTEAPAVIEITDNQKDSVIKSDIFTVVEEMPEFPGGQDEMLKFISKNIKYPDQAKDKDIQGTVYLKFIVEKNGKLSHIETIRRNLGSGLNEEAIRIVQIMPAWKPGRQNGNAVRVEYILPIRFAL